MIRYVCMANFDFKVQQTRSKLKMNVHWCKIMVAETPTLHTEQHCHQVYPDNFDLEEMINKMAV